jgi:hypothetical protein
MLSGGWGAEVYGDSASKFAKNPSVPRRGRLEALVPFCPSLVGPPSELDSENTNSLRYPVHLIFNPDLSYSYSVSVMHPR